MHYEEIYRTIEESLAGCQRLSGAKGLPRLQVPDYGFAWAVQTAASLSARPLQLFASDEGNLRLSCVLSVSETETVLIESLLDREKASYPALSSLLPALSWPERESASLLGVRAEGVSLRSFLQHDPHVLTLRHDARLSHWPLSDQLAQPQAVTGAQLLQSTKQLPSGASLATTCDGEIVIAAEYLLGAGHRGIERALWKKTPNDALPLVERICSGCGVSLTEAFCRAVENIIGAEVSAEAAQQRHVLIVLEQLRAFARDMSSLCRSFDFVSGEQATSALQEQVARLSASTFGHRMLFNTLCLGGLRREPHVEGWPTALDSLQQALQDLGVLLKRRVRARLQGLALLSPEAAAELGATGCLAMAQTADAWERTKARWEALKLALSSLPSTLEGRPVQALPPYRAGCAVARVQGPYGESQIFVCLDSDGLLERLHITSASYHNATVLQQLYVGASEEDLAAIEASAGLCLGCLER